MTQVLAQVVDPPAAITQIIPRPRVRREVVARVATTDAAATRRRTAAWVPLATETVATAVAAAVVALVLTPAPTPVVLAAVAWLLLLASTGHHRRPSLGESRGAAGLRVLVTGIKALVLAAASAPLWRGTADHRELLWLAAAFTATSAVVAIASPVRPARVVVAGTPAQVRDVLVELGSANRHQVVAVCLTRHSRATFGDIPAYVGLDDATQAISRHAAEAIVVLPGKHVTPADLRRLQWDVAGSGAGLYLGTGLLDVAPRRARLISSSGLDVLHVAPAALSGPRRVLKDVVERALATFALGLLVPLLLVLAVLVRRDSPGLALFRQERVGRDGRTFQMIKFRSMSVTAESDRTGLVASNEADGLLFKIQQDPRVTRVGRWLRRYSLDELPQLWNVVRGDMSLVGPRPALPQEVARYDVDPLRRLVVKPGITGLWQVSGRSDLSWDESVRLDLRYVDNWSLSLDVAILVRTVRAVLGHRGAY